MYQFNLLINCPARGGAVNALIDLDFRVVACAVVGDTFTAEVTAYDFPALVFAKLESLRTRLGVDELQVVNVDSNVGVTLTAAGTAPRSTPLVRPK